MEEAIRGGKGSPHKGNEDGCIRLGRKKLLRDVSTGRRTDTWMDVSVGEKSKHRLEERIAAY